MDPTPDLRATVQRFRYNRLLLALALAAIPAGPVLVAAAVHFQASFGLAGLLGVAGVLLTLASPFFAAWVLLATPHPVAVPAELLAGADGIRIDGHLVAPRHRIRAGYVIPDRRGALVRIERRRARALHLLVQGADQGRAVLRSLGLDASQVVASFRLRSLAQADRRSVIGYFALLGLIVGAPMASAITGSGAVGAAIAIACLLVFLGWVVMINMPARIVVGADGVLISWFWRLRFIPYAEILRATPVYQRLQGVALEPRRGPVVRLPTRMGWTVEQQMRDTAMLAERINEALTDARAGGLAHDAARLARGERGDAAWIAHLKALGAGANADHRTAPMLIERLWRLLEDPLVAPETRAAAAVALSAAGDPRARERVRVIAGATAAPRLRVALEAAARAEEEADAELAAALTALEAAPPATGAPPRRRATPSGT